MTKKVIVIHDLLMSHVVQDIVTLPNVEAYIFNPISSLASFYNWKQMVISPSDEESPPKGLPSTEGCYTPEMEKFVYFQFSNLKSHVGTIINSSRSIEGTYIELQEKEGRFSNVQLWAIRPLSMWTLSDNKNSNSEHICLDWLDKHAPNSVIYVSFGTTISMTRDQIEELVLGLEESGQNFIWVLREADRANIFEKDYEEIKLPNGYEERTKEVGTVARDWVLQLRILGHQSIGVPLATWPMHSDQPKTAFLMTNILKVGLSVNKWENKNELVTSSAITEVVRRLITSEEGERAQKRAHDLGDAAHKAVKEGGVSRMELESFVARIKS